MKLFVRNLSYSATSQDLRVLFEGLGYVVVDAKVILSAEDGRSRGFGFVTVESNGPEAILDTDGAEHMGRVLQVVQAEERRPRGARRKPERAGRGRRASDDSPSWEDMRAEQVWNER